MNPADGVFLPRGRFHDTGQRRATLPSAQGEDLVLLAGLLFCRSGRNCLLRLLRLAAGGSGVGAGRCDVGHAHGHIRQLTNAGMRNVPDRTG